MLFSLQNSEDIGMVSFSQFASFFGVRRGVTALIGSGGKTSLLLAFGNELRKQGSVILCTGTHILVPEGYPLLDRIDAPLKMGQCVTVGTVCENGKITAPQQSFSELTKYADYIICEADGARCLPLKAHASYEPVIPDSSVSVFAVLGLDGLEKTIRIAAHRPELYAKRLGVSLDTIVTPALAAQMLQSYPRVTGYILNKADTDERIELAHQTAALLPLPTAITVLRPQQKIMELWRNGRCWLS